ncbi:MAG: HD domain-containing phosphohydrolase [Actinomycetota bacterium]
MTQPARAPQTLRAPILVVDDNPQLRQMIRTGLEAFGYRVKVAGDVKEAQERLQGGGFSLVLSDYEMPGGSGLQLLSYVTEVYPHLPFIMLTAHRETDLARTAISTGALDFLSKPFELAELGRVIEQNWARVERDRARVTELTNGLITGTIRALVKAVDAKDPHTAMHSERVTRISLRIGAALGLDPHAMQLLEYAALLHDVGKIGIPDQVLQKPGPLDEAEWALMRQHPVRSAEIVREIGSLAEVATIVRHHHERVDGDGYPDGLAGDAIPELSRIIALADVYEALTSDRSYRPARPHKQAREMIDGGAGSHFDSTLVPCLLSLEDFT